MLRLPSRRTRLPLVAATVVCFACSPRPSGGPPASAVRFPVSGAPSARVAPAPALAPASVASASPAAKLGVPVTVVSPPSGEERLAFEGLIAEAADTLRSPELAANLRSLDATYPRIYVHFVGAGSASDPRTAVTTSTTQLSDVVRPSPPFRYVDTEASLRGGAGDDAAHAGWNPQAGQSGSMTIGGFHLARWLSKDVVERSCAINTVAHELTHLISNEPVRFMSHVTDDFSAALTSVDRSAKRIVPPHAVASYLLGTVAQCTWLQRQGYAPGVDLKACVATFGHRRFNGNRCTQFSGDRPIVDRPDLAPPHEAKDPLAATPRHRRDQDCVDPGPAPGGPTRERLGKPAGIEGGSLHFPRVKRCAAAPQRTP
jgi:hypothetical protein